MAEASREVVPRVEPPRTLSPTGGLAEGLDAHDSAIGLGRGGPVLSALEVAANDEGTAQGNATFDVSIDAAGRVSVSLVNASTSADAWSRVGQAMRSAIDASHVRLPPGANGWHVVARVDAKVQYPNGRQPKDLGTRVEADGLALGTNPRRATVGDPPIVFKKMPGITLAHSGKVCSVRIHLGLGPPIAGGCDPSNIGAHETRVVTTRVVSEGRL
ncbi:MAG TPA: hypothetical protein VGG39_29175 [Polyangiaceae bacterium]|jgi:hypothetical protein